MNVLLLCASGLSTSILVNNMRQYAKNDEKIFACSASELPKYLLEADVILVGPQIHYLLESIEKTIDPARQVLTMMDKLAYRQMDGSKMLQQARDLVKKKD